VPWCAYCKAFETVLKELVSHYTQVRVQAQMQGPSGALSQVTICPSDDGSCIDLTSVGACLARKSVTDSSSSYCTWNTTDEQCSYSDPSFSIQVCVLCMCVCVFVCAACELVVRSLFVCLQWVFMTALCLFLFLFMS